MILKNQKHKFDLPEDVVYLNTAYMSPLLKDVAAIGCTAVNQKLRPFEVTADDFFEPVTHLKKLYAKLIDCDEPERIALVPSVSYGIANVVNNIQLKSNEEVLVLEEQFPSNMYAWKRLVAQYNAKLKISTKPQQSTNVGKTWNEELLDSITEKTRVVAMPHVHWADGTLFDLKAIREKTKKHDALFIIDGTQSVGALPFSVNELKPDALICAGYKWLLGPYSSGLAYYGPYFDDGLPIEENWSNRLNSENFSGLTAYQDNYKPLANKYNVGEQANFIAVPMLTKAIKQLLAWTPQGIQDYCKSITLEALKPLEAVGCHVEASDFRGHHLFGIKLPGNLDPNQLKAELDRQNIYVSIRGAYVRVSPHVYNTTEDVKCLVKAITKVV